MLSMLPAAGMGFSSPFSRALGLVLHVDESEKCLEGFHPADAAKRMRNMSVQNTPTTGDREGSGWDPSVLSRKPFNEQILPFIRRDIVTGRWKPNERLSEPQLCREFGVSRTPLRDAFKVLESEGLITLVPHVGAVITDPTLPDMSEKLELLISLEQFAAFKLALLRPSAAIEEITACHKGMIEAARNANATAYYTMNDDFHRAIVLGAGNKTLADAHERVMWHIHRARHFANEHEPLSKNAPRHHQKIVDAVLSGNAPAAEHAMREHLTEVAVIITGKPDAVMGGKRQCPVQDRPDRRGNIQRQRRARDNHRA